MSRKKIVTSIEDQITDFFMTASQGQCELQLKVANRIVFNRFPPVVEVKSTAKGNGKDKPKSQKSALGKGSQDLTEARKTVANLANKAGPAGGLMDLAEKENSNVESQS